MKTAIWIVCSVFYLLCIPGKFAWCLSFRTSLAPIHVTAAPGDIVNAKYSMTLGANERRTHFKVNAVDDYHNEDGSAVYKDPGVLAHSCATWLQINPVDSTVGPGETLDVKLSIIVPVGTKSGGYWCALMVAEQPDPAEVRPDGASVRMYSSIAIAVTVDILPVVRQARILEIHFGGPQASLRIADTGDCPFVAKGRIEFLKPGSDKPLATVNLPRVAMFCEPVNTATISVDLPDANTLPSGHYLVRVLLDIGLDHYVGAQKEMDVDRGPDTKTQGAGAS